MIFKSGLIPGQCDFALCGRAVALASSARAVSRRAVICTMAPMRRASSAENICRAVCGPKCGALRGRFGGLSISGIEKEVIETERKPPRNWLKTDGAEGEGR
eukprot:scaffold1963_cov242-Pinguiococcus_pyrenoidosus.AAC.11